MTSARTTPIAAMPDVLRWVGGQAVLDGVHDSYVRQASEALGVRLRALRTSSADTSARLEAAIEAASSEQLARVLLAPETIARVLSPHPGGLPGTAAFLEDAFTAEAVLAGRSGASDIPGRTLWTALGDAQVLPAGEVVRSPRAAGGIPLDLDSPHGRSDDVAYGDAAAPRTPLADGDRQCALDRLCAAFDVLSAVGVAAFVRTFTKVLVLLKRETPAFSSGSETRYIGRSALGNPHSPAIDHLDLAEALVHEAIHALLYMEERCRRWVPAKLYEPVPRVVSPWSGRALALRPFLQACFVWYGILQFWGRAMTQGALAHAHTGRRMARAVHGFLGAPLVERLAADDRAAVAPEVLGAISAMQEVVQDAFA